MLVQRFLEEAAQKYPDKNAVWFKKEWMTYGQVESQANKLAGHLVDSGVQRGDRVAILLENSFDYVISYYAVLKAGAVVVALNTENKGDDLLRILEHAEPTLLIAGKKYFRHVLPVLPRSTIRYVVSDAPVPAKFAKEAKYQSALLSEIYADGERAAPSIATIDIDLATIIYTSGSTGEPKGVMLSHLNTVVNACSIVDYLEMTAEDRAMVILPFYYVYGKTLLNIHFAVGGSVVIDNSFTYPNVVLDNMEAQEVTNFAGVPSTFMLLLNRSTVRDHTFPTLKYVTQAGGGMAPAIQKQVVEIFSPAKLFVMYGATELGPRLTWLPPERWEDKLGSIGKAVPNTEAFVADENGVRLPAGTEGEIVGRGSNVMMGYWKDPKGTAEVLRHGLYYTGDRGKSDEDGYLYVVARSKEILKISGKRCSAKEIEDAMLELPDIEEVAVIAVPDDVLGEAAKAFVVLAKNSEQTGESIRKALAVKLPTYKIPTRYDFRESLPKNQSGKVLKTKLSA